jgi:phage tail sheath gpL-like
MIDHDVASNIRRPGRFFNFNYAAAARGLVALDTRVVLVGILDSSGSASAGELKEIFSEAEADAYFGTGSELALMCRWAMKATRDYGKAPEIWAIGIADPAGTAQTNTITVTGTASEAGEIHIRISGRDIRVAVANGDLQADIATAIDDAIDELIAELPVTSAAASNVVTTTAVHTGENGAEVEIDVISTVGGVTVVAAAGVAGAGTVDITASLDLLEDKDYDVVVTANNKAGDIADCADHIATCWEATTKRWRHCLMAGRGTLATQQALATAADDWRQMVVSAEGFRNTPSEIAAYIGTMLAAEPDPALPWNDVALPSLYLPEKADIPTNAELESGIGGGLFMLSTNEAQTEAKIVRAVTTQVTYNAVPFYTMLDYTIGRSFYYGARQIDIAQALHFPRAKKTERTAKDVRSVTLDVMYQLEDLEIWHNIDDHAAELVVETDPVVTDRLVQAVPAAVVAPLNQTVNVMNLIVE